METPLHGNILNPPEKRVHVLITGCKLKVLEGCGEKVRLIQNDNAN